MKILIVMHDFRGGGAERVAIKLANGMCLDGNQVTLLVLNKEGPMINDIIDKVVIHDLNINKVSRSILGISFYIKKYRPDLIVSHMTHLNVAVTISALFTGYLSNLQVVEHNVINRNYKLLKSKTVKLSYIMAKVLYILPKKVVCVSKGVAESINDFTFAKKNISVIYNPVLKNLKVDFKLIPKENLHHFFNGNCKVLINVGSLTEQKNQEFLLDLMDKIKIIGNVKLIILGEGSERENLEKKIKDLNLSEYVSMPGFSKDVYSFIYHSDLFVLCSRWEGLPTVLIESLSLNTPVISYNCKSGPDEIITHKNGVLIDNLVVSEFSNRLLDILSDRIKLTNIQDGLERFNIDGILSLYLDGAINE